MRNIIIVIIPLVFCMSCNRNTGDFDASGMFEAEEIIISAEANGVIRALAIEEGMTLEAGQHVGYIDSTQEHLQKKQLQAQIRAVLSKNPDISAQLAALQVQLEQAKRERERIGNLVREDAATRKQLDDMNTQVRVIQKQIAARQSSLNITSSTLRAEVIPLEVRVAQAEEQLKNCTIINPVNGTVLHQYMEVNEMAVTGKPLYKIADLSTVFLRAYITGNQFAGITLNQPVTVLVDSGPEEYRRYDGVVTWISDKAEFTPKTIQTKEERANLVYAIKIRVKNDGFLKIGMYGEVAFQNNVP